MIAIESVSARQVLDCKCRPMVEVEVRTSTGAAGRGAAPTGQSVGEHEAFVLRDHDPRHYGGLGVRRAVRNVETVIAPALIGMDVCDQAALDRTMIELDGTPDKSALGANAIYSTSIACLRAAAAVAGEPVYRLLARAPLTTLPVPGFNVVNGGRYGDLVQPVNEFIVLPVGAADIDEAVEMGVRVFAELGDVIRDRAGVVPAVASSYGYAAPSPDPRAVLQLLACAVERCGYAGRFAYALDCASSEMFDDGTYLLHGRRVVADELIGYVAGLTREFDLLFVEDLLDEDDWDGFAQARRALGSTLLLGDDLIVTDPARLERAHQLGAVDGFVLKPNQVGTITEALACHDYAVEHGLLAIPSGRSGGVVDDIVMDLSVGLQVPFQKNGAPRSGERIEKLNFLLRAADGIGSRALAPRP